MSVHSLKVLILASSFLYAIVRYNVFGDTPWEHLPLYVTNKAISVAGLLFLGCSLIRADRFERRHLGRLSAALILAHVLISFMILNEHYFARFYYEDHTLRVTLEISMLAGVLGALLMVGLFVSPSATPDTTSKSLRLGAGRSILALTAVHLLLMGYPTWVTPEDWHGYMPPLTLLSFLATIAFVLRKSTLKR